LSQKIFTVQDEPSTWDDEDDAGLESVSEPDVDDPSEPGDGLDMDDSMTLHERPYTPPPLTSVDAGFRGMRITTPPVRHVPESEWLNEDIKDTPSPSTLSRKRLGSEEADPLTPKAFGSPANDVPAPAINIQPALRVGLESTDMGSWTRPEISEKEAPNGKSLV